ncbi:MAG: gluconeogenesis factor YvcK family protein, partial [archaeon]
MKPKRIVVIGGGSGSYNILKGLKPYSKKGLIKLTVIVAMTDSGGSSGQIRDEFGILPPGDVRRCLVALSDETELVKKLFQHRFESKGSLKDHSFGNLFITGLTQILGSEEKAIKEAQKILKVYGNVVPVTFDDSHLKATLENGDILLGESKIDLPRNNSTKKIVNLELTPNAKANKEALNEIKQADWIILGPGDLYTSIIANLLIQGISKTIVNSKAKKVYNCNIMTKNGETNNYTVADHLNEIEKYLGKKCIDYVTYNDKNIPQELITKYAKENAKPVEIR